MTLNEEQLEADKIIVDALKFVGGFLVLGVGTYLAFQSFNSNSKIITLQSSGIEKKLNLNRESFTNQTQYSLRTDKSGCQFLDQYNYLSDDTKLYSMQSEYLLPKNPQDNCRKF